MKSPPLVSIVLPTRDRLPHLREAVGSVLAQTYGHWELIVVDDGSTDASVPFLRSLADRRIRVLERPRRGSPARLRNEALAEATGDYVAFLDSDDAWEPEKLALQLAALGAARGCGWSYTALRRVDALGAEVDSSTVQPWRPYSGRILAALLALEALVALPTVVVERRLLEEVGRFDESLRFGEDYDLWFRLAAVSDALALPEPLCRVRVHSGNYSADRAAVHGCWVQVYDKVLAALDDPALVALCRARRQDHATTWAALLADRGARGQALREIARVLRHDPTSLRAWHVLLGRVALRLPRAGSAGGS